MKKTHLTKLLIFVLVCLSYGSQAAYAAPNLGVSIPCRPDPIVMPAGSAGLLRAKGDGTPWQFALVPAKPQVHILITQAWKFAGTDAVGQATDVGWGGFAGGGTGLSFSWNSAPQAGTFTVTVKFKRWCGGTALGPANGTPGDIPEETLEWGGNVWSVVIKNKGIDITEPQANPQNVMVGEKIDLTATITPAVLQNALSDKQWTLGSGDVVKGYDLYAALPADPANPPTQKTLVPATDLTNANVAYYYTNGAFTGQSVTVSFSAKVNNDPVTATAKFKVFRPRIATVMENNVPLSTFVANFGTDVPENTPYVEVKQGRGADGQPNGEFTMQLGRWIMIPGTQKIMPGIEWTASVETPANMGAGQISYVQLVNTVHKRQNVEGTSKLQLTSNGKFVLDDGTDDNLYGFEQDRSTTIGNGATALRSLADSPSTRVLLPETMSKNDSFALYLMYKPNDTNSIWTTVGVLNWAWDSYITKHLDGTPADRGGHPVNGGGKVKGAESHVLPEWSDTIKLLIARDFQPVP